MSIKRTLPPAAVPIPWSNILFACFYILRERPDHIKHFVNELKSHFEVNYCYLISSGKAALTLILQTLHELSPERNEVLIPAFTCFSVPAAIKNAGLKIRLCDVDIQTLDFDGRRKKFPLDIKVFILAYLPQSHHRRYTWMEVATDAMYFAGMSLRAFNSNCN